MTDDLDDIMRRCQRGFPRHLSHHEAAHELLADCYGAIGRLRAEVGRMRQALYVAREAIAQAPIDAFGVVAPTHEHDGYPIRDELVDRISKVLSPVSNRLASGKCLDEASEVTPEMWELAPPSK